MSPQWLGIQESKQCVPKDKRSICKVDDEEAMSLFDKRTKRVTVKHNPKMLVPVLKVNPGIHNYQSFSTTFCSVIQKEPDFHCLSENYI